MEKPLISVVVPAYNAARFLPGCIDSLLNQTYENLEIIVVDDESRDNTPEVLREYREKYPNFRFIRKKNGGEYAARLSGVDVARGQWIGFVDADDEVEPQMYERLLSNALAHDAQISHCGYKLIYSDGTVEYLQNSGLRKEQDRITALRDLIQERIVETGLCSKLFRRELFAGLWQWMDFSIVNNGDLLMNYYLFSRAEKAFLEDVCPYHYLIREGSASRHAPTEHSLYDPIRARQLLLSQCDPELRDDVKRAITRLCLCAFRDLTQEERGLYLKDEQKLQQLLREQKQWYGVLDLKNRIQVQLILRAPGLYRCLYRAFAAKFR